MSRYTIVDNVLQFENESPDPEFTVPPYYKTVKMYCQRDQKIENMKIPDSVHTIIYSRNFNQSLDNA